MRDVLMDFDDTFIKNLIVLICSMAYSQCIWIVSIGFDLGYLLLAGCREAAD